MLTETSFVEDVGGIKDDSFMIDLDLDIGKLPVSLTPYRSSCLATDISSLSMVESDVSGADLFSALDSICVHESLEPRDSVPPGIKADTFDSVGQAYLSGQCPGDGKDIGEFHSSDLAVVVQPSAQGDGEANVLVGIEKTCTQSHSLIVYTSSRRRSTRNTKPSQKNESPKLSKCRSIPTKSSEFDLSSLQILRKSRSSFAKRARSSVWGDLRSILPDVDKSSGFDQNFGNDKKRRSGGGGKGKRKGIMEQTCKKSTGKSLVPTGRISLKVKIGNKICSLGNDIRNLSASGKDNSELIDTKENKLGAEVPRDVEKVMSSDVPALSSHLQVRGAIYNQSFDTLSNFHEIRNLEEGDNLRGLTEIQCSDVGTSPDSEVINSIPDIQVCEKGLPDLQEGPIVSKARVSKKGKKKVKLHQADDCMLGSKVTGAGTRNNATAPDSMKDVFSLSSPRAKSTKGRKKDKLCGVGNSVKTNLTVAETSNKANGPADLGVYCSDADMRTAKPYLNPEDMKPCSGLVATSIVSNSPVCNTLIPYSNGRKFTKCSSAKGRSNDRSIRFPNEKETACKKQGNGNDLDGNETPFDLGGTGALTNDASGPINIMPSSFDGVREQYDPLRNAWVLCDECQQWRRIPAALADQIEETDCGWVCRYNTDKGFADCSIPQEKSNSKINEELEISDGFYEEDACGAFLKPNEDQAMAAQQSSWKLIKSNLFLHRSRKTQTIDEVMVCHCKPPSDGRMGCGTKCLNRMLNIECVQGTCPCGERCSNQQFQTRKYAKLKWFRCGKKGYGLQALEDMPQGQFLIEYVGEVLDVHAYEARQREYAMMGHKHFYFMTLNGSEVIDACAQGNLGRFINHSCDPNCRTEKWMVNGEVCIGLFSLRDIKKGEEVTFDYNFVRVFGAAAKKCVCGSANCRGYIGGDLTNSEVIAQDDSDDEYKEPVMICEDGEMNKDWNDIMLNNSNDREDEIAKEPSHNIYSMEKLIDSVSESIIVSHTSKPSPQKVGGVNSAQVAEVRVGDGFRVYDSIDNKSTANVVEKLNNNKTKGESLKRSTPAGLKVECRGIQSQMRKVKKAMSSAHESTISVSHSKTLSDKVECKRNLKHNATVEGSDVLTQSNSLTKTNRSLSSIKKGKPKLNALKVKVSPNVDKLSVEMHKSKKLPKLPLSHHFEAVMEKLNELLDPEGGISKRKDASKGYLKLLFLTAATGNNGHGEAIQSNRDLSMILDALLKTKSRTVLVDIINKNGLQMLHNILKRCRKEFTKTPILRKLLKVLEYLATREILTLEHITGGPPCPGVESFKDSVLTLTEHLDKQVHQIARNFRDKWIHRSLRKNCCMERDDGIVEYHQPSSHGGLSVSYDQSDRGGKPSEATNSVESQSVAASSTAGTTLELSASGSSCRTNEPKTRKRKSRWDIPAEHPHSRNRNNSVGDDMHDADQDIPPGFSNLYNGPMNIIPSDASSIAINHQEREMQTKQHSLNIVLGDPQLRFIARMPVSYGVPYSVMQQFAVPQADISEGWTIAPGMPFHPFPPLPPCAPNELDESASARCPSSCASIENARQSSDACLTYQTDQQNTKTCGMDSSEKNVSDATGRPDFQQGSSCSLGRKYFRQQKWNHSKLPPWLRMRNGWGSTGNNARNVSPGVGLANGPNDCRNSCNSNDDYRREF
ncbi:histone-lysine N-methyltransferase [Perilla frutescens var. hirtella]|uniref:Histone-lysine N-methyltransferase n=1 Tax=Perilla frutescens var. hirtella TaxID=608512 RepID=A0AAD4PAZ3_PERFH|nr:histone-lysine N-methyltransferase [Perilla frutescens var. hirtella]